MKKITKRILLTALTLLTAFCACFAIACGDKTTPGKETIAPPDDGMAKIDYRITVLYPDKTPVFDAEVRLYEVGNDSEAHSGATTGSDGVAVLRASKGLSYYIELYNLPDGYSYSGDDELSETETSKTVYIENEGVSNQYELSLVTVGGMPLKGVTLSIKSDNDVLASKNTDKDGLAKIRVPAFGEYDIEVTGLPKGYSLVEESLKTDSENNEKVIKVVSAPIQDKLPANHKYYMDDIIYDFTVRTSTGETLKLSDILKTKKFVLINFWFSTCGPCRSEFEGLQKAYEKHENDSEVLALSIMSSDSDTVINNYKANYGYKLTLKMGRDEGSLFNAFSYYAEGAAPTSIMIDRYGKICNFIKGSASEAMFKLQFAKYTAEDYVQTVYDPNLIETPDTSIEKPNVDMPDSEDIHDKINTGITGTYVAPEGDTYWPWVITDDGISPANLKKSNSAAVITFKFTINRDSFLTFKYKTNTEDISGADPLDVYIDGSKAATLDRVTSNEWKTFYAFTPRALSDNSEYDDAAEEHTLMIMYSKDSSDGWLTGDECVTIKDMTAVALDTIEESESVNLLRQAAWGYDQENSRLTKYANVVLNEKDGYYHVGTVDGPLLLANICGETLWSPSSVSSLSSGGYFVTAGYPAGVTYITNGTSDPNFNSYVEYGKGYAWYAQYSYIENYCPVDEQLQIVLDQMTRKFCERKLAAYYDKNTWLELCAYYDNYSGAKIDNPIRGLCQKEAIAVTELGKAVHVVVDRVLVPRGIIHKFDCQETGAYRVYSKIGKEYVGKQGAYVYISGTGKDDDAVDNFNLYVTFEAGKTYYIGVAFDLPDSLGELDFFIEKLGVSYDNFTYASDGTFTFKIDENGNNVLDEDGNIVTVINRHNNLHAKLGSDEYYHQVLPDGSIDMGEKSYMYVTVSGLGYMLDYSLLDLATGKYRIDTETLFFDFTDEGGEDYSDYIIKLAESAATDGETKGMVKADKKLVEVLTRALARVGLDEEDAWFGYAFYYEHIGIYPSANS